MFLQVKAQGVELVSGYQVDTPRAVREAACAGTCPAGAPQRRATA
jgi:hypothetical protein